MNKDYCIILAAYGNDYNAMILSCLFSIKNTNPDVKILLLYQDVNDEFITLIKKIFVLLICKKTQYVFSRQNKILISSKVSMWNEGIQAMHMAGFKGFILLDIDVLVIKNLSPLIERLERFDIIFSVKSGIWPLNTGVLLTRNNENVVFFFKKWLEETEKVLKDTKLMNMATSKSYPFGGGDQMSFYNLISFKTNICEYNVVLQSNMIKLKALPSKYMNETSSTTISDFTNIIHYKGGWHNILLKGWPFSNSRTFKNSYEMYVYYINTYIQALTENNISKSSADNLNIYLYIPLLFNKIIKNRFIYYPVSLLMHYKKISAVIKLVFTKCKSNN